MSSLTYLEGLVSSRHLPMPSDASALAWPDQRETPILEHKVLRSKDFASYLQHLLDTGAPAHPASELRRSPGDAGCCEPDSCKLAWVGRATEMVRTEEREVYTSYNCTQCTPGGVGLLAHFGMARPRLRQVM